MILDVSGDMDLGSGVPFMGQTCPSQLASHGRWVCFSWSEDFSSGVMLGLIPHQGIISNALCLTLGPDHRCRPLTLEWGTCGEDCVDGVAACCLPVT